MSDVNLFEHPTPTSERDAIHVAIEPGIAGSTFNSYDKWIRKFQGKWYACDEDEAHGIINCWNEERVAAGQLFWVMIKPGTVNGMRHHWSHPELDKPITTSFTKEESKQWLEIYCAGHDCPSLEDIIEAISGHPDYIIDDTYFHCKGRDAHGQISPEFWFHFENYTGFKTEKPRMWSCSC